MSYLVLQTQTVPLWNWGGSIATLRIFSSQSFYEATTGELIPQGQVSNINSFCQRYTCSISGHTVTIPEVTLPTTTDSTVPDALYTAVLYDSTDAPRYTLLSQFFVDPAAFQIPPQSSLEVTLAGTVSARGIYTYRGQNEGKPYYNLVSYSTSTSNAATVWDTTDWNIRDGSGNVLYTSPEDVAYPWQVVTWIAVDGAMPVPAVDEYPNVITSSWEQLTLSNQAFATVSPGSWGDGPFFNEAQTKQYVNSLVGDGTTPFSNSLVCGKSFLSADPILPQVPIAVGQNDPYWQFTINRKVLSIDYDNYLPTAISDIGSTPTELLITEESLPTASDVAVPATLTLTFEETGQLNVAGGHTVLIRSMSPAPSRQLFTGSGTVTLDTNAVQEKNLSWWAGNSSSADLTSKFNQFLDGGGRCYVPPGVWKCTNVTIPSYTSLRGASSGSDGTTGTVIQLYDLVTATCALKVSEAFRHISVRDLTISVSSSTASSPFIAQGTFPNTAVGLFLENVTFYGTGTNSPAQFYIHDLGGMQWQCEKILLNHCEWITPAGGISYRCESVNTSTTMIEPIFGGGANFTACYGDHFGFTNIIGGQAAGVGLSAIPWDTTLNRTIKGSITSGTKDLTITVGTLTANDLGRPVQIGTGLGTKLQSYIDSITDSTHCTVHDNATATATNENLDVYEYVANPVRGNTFIHRVGAGALVNLIGCVDEGMTYFIKNDSSDASTPIQLTNCWPQSWIQADQSCVLNVQGCRLSSQTFRTGSGALCVLNENGNTITLAGLPIITGNVPVELLTATLLGQQDGTTIVTSALNYNEGNIFRQMFGQPTDFTYGQAYRFAPDTTTGVLRVLSSIDTTSGPDIKLIEYGRSDTINEQPLYTYQISRDFDTGFSITEGNQTAPYSGHQFNNGPVVGDTFVGGEVTTAQITTDAGTYYPLSYQQNVRMSSNANHTIGGLVFPSIDANANAVPGRLGTHAYLINVGVHNITILHQSGGDNAIDRFICDTGSNIVCAPGEIIHVVRDGTGGSGDRWRASKFNLTNITSNSATTSIGNDLALGAGLTVANDVVITGTISIGGGAALDTSDFTGIGNLVRKGSPTLVTPVLGVATGTSLAVTGLLQSSGTAGVGYATGAGSSQSQSSSKSTAVTLNKICGQVTMNNASLNDATTVSFTLNNSTIASSDVVILNHSSGGTAGAYIVWVSAVGSNSCQFSVRNVSGGALGEAIVLSYAVIKAVSS